MREAKKQEKREMSWSTATVIIVLIVAVMLSIMSVDRIENMHVKCYLGGWYEVSGGRSWEMEIPGVRDFSIQPYKWSDTPDERLTAEQIMAGRFASVLPQNTYCEMDIVADDIWFIRKLSKLR